MEDSIWPGRVLTLSVDVRPIDPRFYCVEMRPGILPNDPPRWEIVSNQGGASIREWKSDSEAISQCAYYAGEYHRPAAVVAASRPIPAVSAKHGIAMMPDIVVLHVSTPLMLRDPNARERPRGAESILQAFRHWAQVLLSAPAPAPRSNADGIPY